jgi:hypothetical protein
LFLNQSVAFFVFLNNPKSAFRHHQSPHSPSRALFPHCIILPSRAPIMSIPPPADASADASTDAPDLLLLLLLLEDPGMLDSIIISVAS